ncbi:tetratricopeptide repeat protein [Phosphitispora fastidiosa]|uniref:tetratricopeptide repeat protein n=1 Tax=Phosphitispora fastidiosa TaxID=2837202 RepID=UPI001E5FD233|nr:hypothetical protein [Phosphitispora fastidiosa]MBU7007093.1 tetratricopeptide (TPR) repeat protein [Phosphitispora fastidiosa]
MTYTGKAPSESFAAAVELHDLGVKGDQEAVPKACRMFEKMWSENPDQHLAEAYLGSATALLGRDHADLDEKFRLAVAGLKLLDSAVSKDEHNVEIRILRGHVCFNLPEMYFHRLHTAVEDFEFLVSCYRRNKRVFSKEFYVETIFNLGSAYKQLGRDEEAEAVWKKLLFQTRDPKYLNRLRQEGIHIPQWMTGFGQRLGQGPGLRLGQRLGAVEAPESSKKLEEAREMHRRAASGSKEEVAAALAYFEKAVREDPGNNLFRAYHADCLSMAGRVSDDHALLFGNAIKALIDLDKAVNGNPENIQIRLLRANHSHRLPEQFFRRSATAMGDYEYLLQRYQEDQTIFDQKTWLGIQEKLGQVYERLEMKEEAGMVWEKLHDLTGEKKYLHQQNPEEIDFDAEKVKGMNWKQVLQEGIRLHDLGVAGNKKAARIAKALLEGVSKAKPGNLLAKAYYGSSLALTGWYSPNPGDMFGNGIKGFKIVKEAAERDPNNLQLRILRGYMAYNLPENFFHMTGLAVKDFRFLIQAYKKDQSIFPKEFYRQVLYDLGAAYQRIGETGRARKVWASLEGKSQDSE